MSCLLAPFDVYRKEKKRHCRALVCELDYTDDRLSGICFKYTDDDKEWMVFGARTIFPFKSKLKKRSSRPAKIKPVVTNLTSESLLEGSEAADDETSTFQMEVDRSELYSESTRQPEFCSAEGEAALKTTLPRKGIQRRDPSNFNSFVVGGKLSLMIERLEPFSARFNSVLHLFFNCLQHPLMYTERTNDATAGVSWKM